MSTRRGFLFGGTTLLAAPAIVRISSLMPVSRYKTGWYGQVNMYGVGMHENVIDTGALCEMTIEQMLIALRAQIVESARPIQIKPTHVIWP